MCACTHTRKRARGGEGRHRAREGGKKENLRRRKVEVETDGSFSCVVKHKDDGQTKFIKLNSQRQDRIIKYWVSIGSIHREQG